MPVETRNSRGKEQEKGRYSSSPHRPKFNPSTTGPRTAAPVRGGLQQHVQKQLLQDIEASGEGIARLTLRPLCDRKSDIYGEPGTERRRQVQNKFHRWKLLETIEYHKLLNNFGVYPNVRSQESEEEEEEPTPSTPTAHQHHQLPPRSPPPIQRISMSTPSRSNTPNRIGTPNGRTISDMMSQMSSKYQCSSAGLLELRD